MINEDDRATIRHRSANEKISNQELAKQLGVSRGTMDRALAADAGNSVGRACGLDWVSTSLFRVKVAAIGPEYAPADPADRLVFGPGKTVQ